MKRQATSVIPMPLTFDKEKQLWKVAGWFIESSEETEELIPSKLLAFEGYTDDETFKTQNSSLPSNPITPVEIFNIFSLIIKREKRMGNTTHIMMKKGN